METRANYLLIGVVTLAGFLGMLAFLMWFAKIELDRQFDYYDVYFTEVSGLSRASQVRFAGLPVGQVLDMQLAEDGSGRVRVRLEVARDTPVREDSRASLESQGVTGVTLVGITAGSPQSPLLDTGQGVPVIASTASALQTLADQGPEIIEKLNTVAEQLTVLFGEENQGRVTSILDNIERSSGNLDAAIADISSATGAIADTATAISGFGEHIAGLSDSARQTLDKADTALDQFTQAATRADETLASATRTLDSVRDYVDGGLGEVTTQLRDAADKAGTLADRALTSLDGLDSTLASATRTFDGANGVIETDIGPVLADLRTTLTSFGEAVDRVSADIPDITERLRSAADSADTAFASLRSMLDGARDPVQAFTRDGLVQFTSVARDARALVENLNQLVTALRRNPAQVITGPRQPEFRR